MQAGGLITPARRRNSVIEYLIGNEEAVSLNLTGGSRKSGRVVEGAALEMLLGGLPLPGFESQDFRLPWLAERS